MTGMRLIGLCASSAVAALGACALSVGTLRLWRAVRASPDPSADELAGLACALSAWAVVAWLTASVLLTMAAATPGVIGRFSHRWAVRITPVAVRAALGLAVGVSPMVGTAAFAPPAAASDEHVAIDEHVATDEHTDDRVIGRPLGSAADPSTVGAAADDHRDDPPPKRRHNYVVVQPGDSLWSISADYLGTRATPRDIASEWPRWFAANRDEIGRDPNVLHVGTKLTPPEPHDLRR